MCAHGIIDARTNVRENELRVIIMSTKLYRVKENVTGAYISKVAGCLRSEQYTKVDSAYVYNKQQAIKIIKIMQNVHKSMLKDKNLPNEIKEKIRMESFSIVEVSLNDVRLSLEEITMALEAAIVKKISKHQAFKNAQWERIRRYSNYFNYNPNTPSHKYIYMHDFF